MSDCINLYVVSQVLAKDKSTVKMRVKTIKVAFLYYFSFSKQHLLMVTWPELQAGDLMVMKIKVRPIVNYLRKFSSFVRAEVAKIQ